MRKTLSLLSLLTLLFMGNTILGQSKKQIKAANIAREAIKLMDQGYFDKSIEILKESKKLDPSNINYPYEIAYAHYLKKEYSKSIKILKGLSSHRDASDIIYQLLGYSYNGIDKQILAIEAYKKGLEVFPYSGLLNLELGLVNLRLDNINDALSYFESGIEGAPSYSSNYYWATKIHEHYKNHIWALIYGEIFMNIERTGDRNLEISKLLYSIYKDNIKIINDSTHSIRFVNKSYFDNEMNNSDKPPFESSVFEPLFLEALYGTNEVSIKSLDTIRMNFATGYFKKGYDLSYPNLLFSFHKNIIDAGFFEEYNHWIFNNGNAEEFNEWFENNKEKWKSFIDWFINHGIVIDEFNRFFRGQY